MGEQTDQLSEKLQKVLGTRIDTDRVSGKWKLGRE